MGRSFTGWASGSGCWPLHQRPWLHRLHRPGQYDVHGILPTEGGGELTPSVYEQFIARVVDSANAAAEAAKRAASGEANAKQSASEAASSAQQTAASATLAAGYAEQAEAAADRAASYAPTEGAVLSVNGKSSLRPAERTGRLGIAPPCLTESRSAGAGGEGRCLHRRTDRRHHQHRQPQWAGQRRKRASAQAAGLCRLHRQQRQKCP